MYKQIHRIFRSEFPKVIRYGIVGIFNTLFSLGIIFTFSEIFKFDYRLANAIGYFFGISFSYMINRIWTFQADNSLGRSMGLFILIFGISYGSNLLTVIFLVEYMSIATDISQVVGAVIYTMVGYLGNRFIVFNKKNSSQNINY
jgi:putative flippase GtrA